MTVYSLSDFSEISNKGFHVILPDATVSLINELSKLVGSPNYIKTPVFTKRESTNDADKKRRRQRNRPQESSDEWTTTSSTKGTKRISTSSDIGANIVFNPPGTLIKKNDSSAPIQLIRPLLNKLGGNASNQAIKSELFSVINNVFDTEITQEDIVKMSVQIIDIMSGNLFYSFIYATLFSEMMNMHTVFGNTLNTHFDAYISNYRDIQVVDPVEDYDKFCNMNKINHRRKANTAFYFNLYMLDKISKPSILDTIHTLVRMIRENINNIDSQQLVTELVENIFILLDPKSNLFSATRNIMMDSSSAEDGCTEPVCVREYLTQLSITKPKTCLGLNTKSIFKLKDLVDNHRYK